MRRKPSATSVALSQMKSDQIAKLKPGSARVKSAVARTKAVKAANAKSGTSAQALVDQLKGIRSRFQR